MSKKKKKRKERKKKKEEKISDFSLETIEKNSKSDFIESETLENDKEKLYFDDVQLINISSSQSIGKTKFKRKVS